MSIIETIKHAFRRPRPLPDKPSELIRVALEDVRLVEKDDRYIVFMDDWHTTRNREGACHVCLAGAVMAKSLKANVWEYTTPKKYPTDVRSKLFALDHFRSGDVNLGLMSMGWPQKSTRPTRITPYEKDRELFHEDMNELANYLETIGL